MALMLNASAICPASELDMLISEALERISDKFQLEVMILKKECFGMMG